jgi:hypothetical protein
LFPCLQYVLSGVIYAVNKHSYIDTQTNQFFIKTTSLGSEYWVILSGANSINNTSSLGGVPGLNRRSGYWSHALRDLTIALAYGHPRVPGFDSSVVYRFGRLSRSGGVRDDPPFDAISSGTSGTQGSNGPSLSSTHTGDKSKG